MWMLFVFINLSLFKSFNNKRIESLTRNFILLFRKYLIVVFYGFYQSYEASFFIYIADPKTGLPRQTYDEHLKILLDYFLFSVTKIVIFKGALTLIEYGDI